MIPFKFMPANGLHVISCRRGVMPLESKLLSSSWASSGEPLSSLLFSSLLFSSLLSSSSYNTVVCSTQLHLTHCAACCVRDHRPLTSTMSENKKCQFDESYKRAPAADSLYCSRRAYNRPHLFRTRTSRSESYV